jgi:hypothetical protein
VVRANLAALPHLSDKERVVIEKNHTLFIMTCLWNDQNNEHIVKEMNKDL